ncbi:hypothetical protein [Burkholderia territorii]|uniref:hypothetical protein n=1 Tax=Burkholderia territorii TaxID=1503055 RepID=UPI000AE6C1A1|nr:hypothetical protein [Burkholderia territorii]
MAKNRRMTLVDRVIALMSDGQARTIKTMLVPLDATNNQLRKALRSLVAKGAVRIGGTVGASRENFYTLATDAELDRCYRSSVAWWPVADPIVCSAMFAMVRSRDAAAANADNCEPVSLSMPRS